MTPVREKTNEIIARAKSRGMTLLASGKDFDTQSRVGFFQWDTYKIKKNICIITFNLDNEQQDSISIKMKNEDFNSWKISTSDYPKDLDEHLECIEKAGEKRGSTNLS